MATPVSPADALAPEAAVEAAGAVPPRWRARLPRMSLPRLPAGLRLPSKRVMVLAAAGLLAMGGVAAAALAFWPAEPEWPRTPVHKPKKAKRVAGAASSAASAATVASPAASAASAVAVAASGASAVAVAASAASAPESSMDRLQRRLAESLGGNGSLEAGAGELKLTSRRPASPPTRRETRAAAATVAASAPLDLQQLLPRERGYYTYMGSLTTPPCTEGVLWLVMKQPVAVSPQQIALFARLYPMNARPVQPSAGRIIKESD
jgi:hypothetical protein